MDGLHFKYNEYMRLDQCTVEYTFSDGSSVSVRFTETGFLHLLGLHKLVDIQDIQFWQDKNNRKVHAGDVIRKIKNEQLTETTIKSSVFFTKIADRYNSFTYDNLTTLAYTDAIIDFDATKIKSKLLSDYILFEERPAGEYNHLGIAKDNKTNKRYFETFIHDKSQGYLLNQKIVKIKSMTIYNPSGNTIVTDSFEK